MPVNLSPQEFVAKWRNVTAIETAASQSHFNDVCDPLGGRRLPAAHTPIPASRAPAPSGAGVRAGTLLRACGPLLGVKTPIEAEPAETWFTFERTLAKEPKDDPRVIAIAEAAKSLVEQRDAWLSPPDASAAELKKCTLTKLYNQRPTRLALAHKQLDEAVLDAYGRPHGISAEEILARRQPVPADDPKIVHATAMPHTISVSQGKTSHAYSNHSLRSQD